MTTLLTTWALSQKDAPHVPLVGTVAGQPHPGLLHQPVAVHVRGEPPSGLLDPVAVPALALGGPLEVSGVGEEDGEGVSQDQDGGRVTAVAVVEGTGNIAPGEHPQPLHLLQGRDDLRPVLVVGGVDASVGAAAHNPPGNRKTVSSELGPARQPV